MNYNFQQLYKEFERVKFAKEYEDYFKDISDNLEIINRIPFNENEAMKQISDISKKYEGELNWLAEVYNNGMIVVTNVPQRDEQQLKTELTYINNQIPIIALKRELTSHAFNKLLGID